MPAQTSIGRGEKVVEVQSYPRTPFTQQQKRIEMLEKRRIMVGICLIFEVSPQHHDHGTIISTVLEIRYW
jgi:hypothetical protein